MEDSRPKYPLEGGVADSNRTYPDVDSGYGDSRNQSLKTNDESLNQLSDHDEAPAVSQVCPQSLPLSASGLNQLQRTSIRPILKPIDEQIAKRANDVIEQISGLLQEYMARSRRRKYLSRSKQALPSMSIRAIMLGTTTEDAKVCLVIFCTDKDGTHDRIRRFLRKSFVRELYQPIDSTIPSFDMHVFGPSPDTRAGVEIGIQAEGRFSDPSTRTFCGMPVWLIHDDNADQSASLTMGGILEIGTPLGKPGTKRYYGLTAAHGAINPADVDDAHASWWDSTSESDSLSSGSTMSDDSHHISPVEIDWGTSIGAIENEPRLDLADSLVPPGTLTRPVAYSAMRNGASFRDWVLFDFPIEALRPKPNMLQVKGQVPVHLKAPQSFANINSSRSVFIIRSSGVKQATLSPCLGRILLKPGAEFVRAYSVELSNNSDIEQGDSGSWVVDALTFEVYGHLVATDVLLGSYVIPMVDILADVKAVTSHASIDFPSPQPSPLLKAEKVISPANPTSPCRWDDFDSGFVDGFDSLNNPPFGRFGDDNIDEGFGGESSLAISQTLSPSSLLPNGTNDQAASSGISASTAPCSNDTGTSTSGSLKRLLKKSLSGLILDRGGDKSLEKG